MRERDIVKSKVYKKLQTSYMELAKEMGETQLKLSGCENANRLLHESLERSRQANRNLSDLLRQQRDKPVLDPPSILNRYFVWLR